MNDRFYIAHPAYLVGTWVVAGVWVLVSIWADRSAGYSSRKVAGGADIVLRLILAPGFFYDGAIVFTGASTSVDAKWLASKIALYGLLIVISIPLRWIGFELRRALVENDAEGIRVGLSRLALPMLLGWAVILLAAWFGVTKAF